jgi:hypothetical protein
MRESNIQYGRGRRSNKCSWTILLRQQLLAGLTVAIARCRYRTVSCVIFQAMDCISKHPANLNQERFLSSGLIDIHPYRPPWMNQSILDPFAWLKWNGRYHWLVTMEFDSVLGFNISIEILIPQSECVRFSNFWKAAVWCWAHPSQGGHQLQ